MSKLSLISSAVLLASLASQAFAESTPPTFYGALYVEGRTMGSKATKTFADGSKEVTKTTHRPKLFDNGSRVGVKGSGELTENTELLYRVEWRSPVDDTRRNFETRDTWMGIKHKKYGTIKAGRMLSPEAYYRYTYDLPAWGADGNRSNNAIRYESPKFHDTEVWLHYVMDENNSTDSLDKDGFGISVKHEKEDKYGVIAAYFGTNSQKSLHGVKFKDQFRTSGFYNINDKTSVNAIYQYNKFNDTHYGQPSKTNQAIGAGVSHKLDDKNTLDVYAGYGKNPMGKDGDFKSASVAVSHQFTPKIGAYLEATHYITETNVPAHTDSSGNAQQAHKLKEEEPTLILGTSYRF